jgi:methyl-accepting chemotaxis protein
VLALARQLQEVLQAQAGRGLGVVTDDVKGLATGVETSSKQIMGKAQQLDTRIAALAREICRRTDCKPTCAAHRALSEVERGVCRIHQSNERSREVCGGQIESEMRNTTGANTKALSRSETFLQVSEDLNETVAACGQETEDTPCIAAVQLAAQQISRLPGDALRTGTTDMADLFHAESKSVAGRNPAQHTTRFKALAERLFPLVQDVCRG